MSFRPFLRRLKLTIAWAVVIGAVIAFLVVAFQEPDVLGSVVCGLAVAWAVITLLERYYA